MRRSHPAASFLAVLGVLLTAIPVAAQTLRSGGLHRSGAGPLYLTPDSALNRALATDRDNARALFGIGTEGDQLRLAPAPPAKMRWLAAINVPYNGRTLSYFSYDGWLYTTESVKSNQRRRRFDRDVSRLIASNAYHVAYYREQGIEREIVMLVVSPRQQTVRLAFDSSLTGEANTLEYEMGALEAKFLLVNRVTPEHTVIAWRPEDTPRRTRTLDGAWRFHKGEAVGAERPGYDDRTWETVAIPHSWNAEDVFDTRRLKDEIDVYEMYYRGPGWYRKRFSVDTSLRGSRLTLRFQGANQTADVWLNGRRLGRHEGGYTPFEFDVTHAVRAGAPNTLAVRVDNSYNPAIPPHTADFNFYGGVYRQVQLVGTHPVRVERVRLSTPEVSWTRAVVQARTTLANATGEPRRVRLVTHVVDPDREIVQSLVTDTLVPAGDSVIVSQRGAPLVNPLLWSPEHPWLYQARSALYDGEGHALDEVENPLGFRAFRFQADSGFFLNGQPLKLRGVNLHQDYLLLGNAVDVARKREDVRLVKAMGANFVRLAHYPHHPATVAFADTLGLLVWEEIPFVNTVGGKAFAANARQQLREMIERDYNNPSVLLWGIGNEFAHPWLSAEQLRLGRTLAKELHALAKRLDPTRLTVQAHNHVPDESLFGVTDVQGRNRYFGWYEGTLPDFAEALDRDKREHPDWKLIVSEYGADAKRGHFLREPTVPFDFSETYQLRFHQAYLDAIESRVFVAGSAVWNMFDFGSHVKTGNTPHVNQKGLMSFDRRPKAAYYLYQSRWAVEPMVYIVSHAWTHRTGPPGEPHEIQVLSNGDAVELFVDGASRGRRSRADGYKWPVVLAEGPRRLRAVAAKGAETVTDEMVIHFRHARTDERKARAATGGADASP